MRSCNAIEDRRPGDMAIAGPAAGQANKQDNRAQETYRKRHSPKTAACERISEPDESQCVRPLGWERQHQVAGKPHTSAAEKIILER